MYIPPSEGRPIPETDKRPTASWLILGLTALDAFAVGGLVALLIVNRLLVAQLDVYGEAYMAAASAILDFMDDILPYLVGYALGSIVVTLITLVVWATSGRASGPLRYGVVAAIVILVIGAGLWMMVGRQSAGEPVRLVTPTPVSAVP